MINIKRLFCPDLEVKHLLEIPLDLLHEKQIQGLIFDLDNTIIAWDHQAMEAEVIAWLQSIQMRGFKIYIVSNSMRKRVKSIAETLDLPYTARAVKPLHYGFRKALAHFSLEAAQVAVVGDQLFTDVVGGNRIGAFTILVQPRGKKEFFLTTITRTLERLLLRREV